MISPRLQGGYTFIEVMFFLTISAAMFISVAVTLSAQNRRTEFTESVQTFNQYLIDVMNDVGTGYFPSNGDFSCTLDTNGRPTVDASSARTQGQNEDCVFAGKALQFYPNEGSASSDPSKYKAYTLVGARVVRDASGAETEVSSLEDAQIVPLDSGDSDSAVSSGILSAATRISRVVYRPGSASASTGGGFAILSGFGQSGTGGVGLKSGNIRSSLASLPGTSLNQTEADFVSRITDLPSSSIGDVRDGVLICLAEGSGNNGRRASILLGGSSGQNTTEVKIDNVPAECTS